MASSSEKKIKRSEGSQAFHWTDITAEKIIREKGDKDSYVVAAGITPSGVVHIGNFREIITADLVKRALEKKGKKVRFIYSWDNYDVFRKVPKNMPKPEILEKYLRKAIVDTPDTFGCHNSYAEHHQAKVEQDVPKVGIHPEFLYQAAKYRSGNYVPGIKKALEHTEIIKKILSDFREDPVSEDWLPVTLFCEMCGKDTVKILWLGGYQIKYSCGCGHAEAFDFKKKPILKLKWRIDWPMRWDYEQVDFEPGGKDHSTVGGSYDTGQQIVKEVYEYFDQCERIYFGEEKVNEKELIKQKAAYELSSVKKVLPKTIPYQPGFRHLTTLLQIHSLDIDKVVAMYEQELNNSRDRERVRVRTECAKNWLLKHAPEEFRFTVQEKCPIILVEQEKNILKQLAKKLHNQDWTDKELHEEMYILCTNNQFPHADFFKLAYRVLINKDKGPRLASFILAIGKEKVAELLERV